MSSTFYILTLSEKDQGLLESILSDYISILDSRDPKIGSYEHFILDRTCDLLFRVSNLSEVSK